MRNVNNKGLSYVEVLTVLGITSVITASIIGAAMNVKEKAIDMTEEYVDTCETVEEMTMMDADFEKEGELYEH